MAGKSTTISTSKIRKIIVIKKNRKENGNREDEFLSNPHSKGEAFSRSILVFKARSKAIIITKVITKNKIGANIINVIIIFSTCYGPFDWKSNILYTKKINYLINK